MNTKVAAGVVVLIIIVGGAYYVWGKGGAMQEQSANTPAGGGSSMSLGALVAAGQPVTCTFSTTTASGSESGTMYIANGMVAGDFTSTGSSAGAIDAHMIVRDQTSYVWTSASPQGFKSSVTASGSASTPNQGVDYNAQGNYSCQPWTPDSTKFDLPSSISFISTASYQAPAQGAGATGAASAGAPAGTSAMCAECNAYSGAQKAQCLAALNC